MQDFYNEFASITAGAPLPFPPHAIYCGGAGNLVVRDYWGNTSTFAVIAGTTVAIEPTVILSTTTATSLIAMRKRSPESTPVPVPTPPEEPTDPEDPEDPEEPVDPDPSLPVLPVTSAATGGSATSGTATFTDYLTGDLLIAFVGAITAIDITSPAGWTALATERDDQSATSNVFWRIAASNGADTLGDWGTGRPRYIRVRNVNPITPIRQFAFASGAGGTSDIAHPALPGSLSGNSLVLTFAAIKSTAQDVAPAQRTDTTALYTRTSASGYHSAVGVSTAVPAASSWPAQTAGLTSGTNTLGWHAWAIEVDGIPASAPAVTFDATVSTLSALQAAINDAPMNRNGDWTIGVAPGTYAGLTVPQGYSRGSTRVRIRASTATRPVFRGIDARRTDNLSFEMIDVVGNVMDVFGFPQGSSFGTRGIRITDATRIRLHGVLVEEFTFGIEANNLSNSEISYSTVRAFGVDGIRLYSASPGFVQNVRVHHTVVDIHSPTSNRFPDLTTRGLHYALPRTVGVDPRRSDQKPYGNATSLVQAVDGSLVSVSADTKLGRHPDCIQLAGRSIGVTIEDCDLYTDNLYCHGIYLQNITTDPAQFVQDITIRRVRIRSAHPHAIAFNGGGVGARNTIRDVLIRQIPGANWALNMPGAPDEPDLMVPGISSRQNTGANVNVTNTVLPAAASGSYWTVMSRINASNMVFSDAAEPTGWASTAVATGAVGYLSAT